MKIKYIFKHIRDGDFQSEVFTLNEIEKGSSLHYVDAMKKDGYKLIDRLLEK